MDTRGWLEGAMRDAGTNGGGGAQAGAGGIATGLALAELGRAWPGPLTATQGEALEALCRKIHVAKQVTARYGPGWKKDAAAPGLGTLEWRLLVVVLIAYAAAQKPDSEAGRGLALKLINAALAALDLAAGKLDPPVHAALGEGAESMMRLVLEGANA